MYIEESFLPRYSQSIRLIFIVLSTDRIVNVFWYLPIKSLDGQSRNRSRQIVKRKAFLFAFTCTYFELTRLACVYFACSSRTRNISCPSRFSWTIQRERRLFEKFPTSRKSAARCAFRRRRDRVLQTETHIRMNTYIRTYSSAR